MPPSEVEEEEASDREIQAYLEAGQAAGGDRPFFLYLPLTAPHKPARRSLEEPHPPRNVRYTRARLSSSA